MEPQFAEMLEPVLCALARIFASEGDALAVALLSNSKVRLQETGYDADCGGQTYYTLFLESPETIHRQVVAFRDPPFLDEVIAVRINQLTPQFLHDRVTEVVFSPELIYDEDWREKGRAFATGQGITNQGRARSDNLAPKMCDGLLFRSQPEINLYRALKATGVPFAPLPVFVRGGLGYRRIEPDFVILKDGVMLIVEVDGDTVHVETPLEAHSRTTMLAREGAHVERINASECDAPEKAKQCAAKILGMIAKIKTNK